MTFNLGVLVRFVMIVAQVASFTVQSSFFNNNKNENNQYSYQNGKNYNVRLIPNRWYGAPHDKMAPGMIGGHRRPSNVVLDGGIMVRPGRTVGGVALKMSPSNHDNQDRNSDRNVNDDVDDEEESWDDNVNYDKLWIGRDMLILQR